MLQTSSEQCDHNDIVVHGWFIKYKLWRVCIYCAREIQYPGTYWRRKSMEVASKPLKKQISDEYMKRIEDLANEK
jgi:sugar phosphate permease